MRPVVTAALVLLIPGSALAWTEANVRTVTAAVEVDSHAMANVELDVLLQVRGGWLEGFEIAGLEPEIVVDETSVRFSSSEGEILRPGLRVRDDGRIQLSFSRREAPRRGEYHVRLDYRIALADRARATDEGIVLEWTLPGWRSGLDGVSVEVLGPSGLDFARDEGEIATVERERHREADGRHRITWRRAHLPRTLPWSVAFVVPADQMDPALNQPELEVVPAPRSEVGPVASGPPGKTPLYIALFALLLSLGSIVSFERRCRRLGTRPRGLVGLPSWARALGAVAGAAGAMYAADRPIVWLASLALTVTFSLERAPTERQPLRLGSWRPASEADLRAAKRKTMWRHATRLLEISSPAALVLLLSLTYCLALLYRADLSAGAPFRAGLIGPLHGWLLLVIPFLTGRSEQLPMGAEEKLVHLSRVSQADEMLVLHVDATGQWQEARARLEPDLPPPGLIRLDIAVALTPTASGLDPTPKALVVTRASSSAEEQVAALLPATTVLTGPGGRIGRIITIEQARELRPQLEQDRTEEQDTVVDDPVSLPTAPEEDLSHAGRSAC